MSPFSGPVLKYVSFFWTGSDISPYFVQPSRARASEPSWKQVCEDKNCFGFFQGNFLYCHSRVGLILIPCLSSVVIPDSNSGNMPGSTGNVIADRHAI